MKTTKLIAVTEKVLAVVEAVMLRRKLLMLEARMGFDRSTDPEVLRGYISRLPLVKCGFAKDEKTIAALMHLTDSPEYRVALTTPPRTLTRNFVFDPDNGGIRLRMSYAEDELPTIERDPKDLQHLRGRFAGGYTPETVETVLGQINDHFGTSLAILWDYSDRHGFGGNSCYVAVADGTLLGVSGGTADLHAFLVGAGGCPASLTLETGDAYPFADHDGLNYATEVRR